LLRVAQTIYCVRNQMSSIRWLYVKTR